MLQDTISAHQIGGIVKMTGFVFKITIITELIGAIVMLPAFMGMYGKKGIWMAIFHSISAFCNAGFDIMGEYSGKFTSIILLGNNGVIVFTICALIMIGGIGFLTWDDIASKRFNIKGYRMQSKVILLSTFVLIIIPTLFFMLNEFEDMPVKERILSSVFQAITPRTAGFNTVDIASLSGAGKITIIILMLIGGAPGSTAGGIKTTTFIILLADTIAVFKRRKSIQLFGRRVEEGVIRSAAALLVMYMILIVVSGIAISIIERLPITHCIFETTSAIGTVGLSLGVTPMLGAVSRLILIILMFVGRVGGLTLIYAATTPSGVEVSTRPIERINVG